MNTAKGGAPSHNNLVARQLMQYPLHMLRLILRPKFHTCTAILLLTHSWIGAATQSIRFKAVSREVVESRLRKYSGSNQEREQTLKRMFIEAGCDDQHISEQQVT